LAHWQVTHDLNVCGKAAVRIKIQDFIGTWWCEVCLRASRIHKDHIPLPPVEGRRLERVALEMARVGAQGVRSKTFEVDAFPLRPGQGFHPLERAEPFLALGTSGSRFGWLAVKKSNGGVIAKAAAPRAFEMELAMVASLFRQARHLVR